MKHVPRKSVIVDSTFHHPIFPDGIHPGVEVITNPLSLDNNFEDGYIDYAELEMDYSHYDERYHE